MTVILLTDDDFIKLTKCLRLTTSNHDGEILAGFAAVNRILADYKLDWSELWTQIIKRITEDVAAMYANPPVALMLSQVIKALPPHTKGHKLFKSFLTRWQESGHLTDRQMECLRDSYDRYCK